MDIKGCRFPGIEKLRRERDLSQDVIAAFVGMKKDWYQRLQKWEVDATWSQVLRIAAGMKMNLDSVRNCLSSAPAISPEKAAEDFRKIEEYRARQSAARIRREIHKVAEKPGAYRPGRKK